MRRAGGNGRRLRWPSEAVGRAGSPAGGHARDAWPYGRVWVLCGGLPLVYSAQQRQKPHRQQQQPQGQRQHPKGGGAPQRGGAPAPPTASEASTTPPTRPTAAIGAPPTPGAAMARSAGATATQGRIATPAGRAAAPAAPPTPRVGATPPEPAAPDANLAPSERLGEPTEQRHRERDNIGTQQLGAPVGTGANAAGGLGSGRFGGCERDHKRPQRHSTFKNAQSRKARARTASRAATGRHPSEAWTGPGAARGGGGSLLEDARSRSGRKSSPPEARTSQPIGAGAASGRSALPTCRPQRGRRWTQQ